jgi:hypothetical protein
MTVRTDIENGVVVVSEVGADIVDGVTNEPEFWSEYKDSDWMEPVKRSLAAWAEGIQQPSRRTKRSIFDRDKFVTPGKIFEQMAMAEDAMDDDVVGGVYDITESMAFKRIMIETQDEDEQDIWSQIGRDINLDRFLRMAWRELFKVSQYYGVAWWGNRSYKVRGEGDGGRARRREFNIRVPIGLGVLDPTRVVPVAFDMFGNHSLAWIADESEYDLLAGGSKDDRVLDDELVSTLFLGKYNPNESERAKLATESIPVDRLIQLNPENTWTGTETKATYERWARVRLKSVYPLLDMKHQLREMDRAFLLGGINFIVLVKKGTEEHPVQKASEVTAVANQMRSQSKSSVIVSDHRLSIEIITPDLEHILEPKKWAVLDDRVRLRLIGGLAPPGDTGNAESQVTLAKIATLGIENRRHMLKRDIELNILRATSKRNAGDFDDEPSLMFLPRRLDMLFDSQVATEIQEIRDRGELSRETFLEEFNFDLALETKRRKAEKKEGIDKVFEPIQVPFDSPQKLGGQTPGQSGRKGGGKPGQKQPEDPEET